MTNIRRYFQKDNLLFTTHVTHNRVPILIEHFDLLRNALDSFEAEPTSGITAWVVLPDHIHLLTASKKDELSSSIKKLKLSFSARYRKVVNIYGGRTWQYRYWDHIIRDQDDFNRHIDYIHYNPVKHGLAKNPFDWEYSSIHDFRKGGYYRDDWGGIDIDGEFGE